MKLSTKGRYAVMAMVDLAMQGDDKPVCLADVAERQEISLSYLEQLFSRLRRGALVKSVRGPGGGYMLARAADELWIADIVMAVDEPITAVRCKPGSPVGCRSDKSRCLTHVLWEELGNQIHLYLSSISLDDVCNRRVLGTSGALFHGNRTAQAAPEPPVAPVAAVEDCTPRGTAEPTEVPAAAAQ